MEDSQFKRSCWPAHSLTSLVDPMRRELSRWTERLPNRRTSDRWTRWVADLVSKHIAFEQDAGFSRMILARRGFVERILRESWLSSINLYPLGKLSLPQVLKLFPNSLAHSRKIADAGQPQFSSDMRRYGVDQIDLKSDGPVLIPMTVKDRTMSHTLQRDTPLNRIFLRTTEVRVLSRSRISFSETALDSTQRIISAFRRVEERRPRSNADAPLLVVKQTMPFAVNDDNSLDAGQGRRETRQSFSAMEVDELTNQVIHQIDQRATAWRERMGKI